MCGGLALDRLPRLCFFSGKRRGYILQSRPLFQDWKSHTTFQLGSVYDINDKQSVGAEFNMTENPYHNNTDGTALAIES